MTREELLKAVNAKEDTAKLTSLSRQTIDEELDDLLEDYGEGEEPDDKAVEKLAKRLKRMAGNIHAGVSAEMKKNRDEAERKRREREAERKRNKKTGREGDGGDEGDGDEGDGGSDDKLAALEAKLAALTESLAARDKASKKAAALDAVKKGLKAKFEAADLEVNDFFLETALGKIVIPDEGEADVQALVKEAEGIYTSDYKRATGSSAVPGRGQQCGGGGSKPSEHEWDDIIERRKRRFGDAGSSKK